MPFPRRRRRSKYGATPVIYDGVRFDSKAEGARYLQLKLELQAGTIRDLTIHVPYALHAGATKLGTYEADFVYDRRVGDTWTRIVEDVKGVRTPLYNWKKKHLRAEHGITIAEITARPRTKARDKRPRPRAY